MLQRGHISMLALKSAFFSPYLYTCSCYSQAYYFSFPEDYDDPDDLMHSLYHFKSLQIMVNCGEDWPFSTNVKSERIYMLVCINGSYEGHDASYFKDIVLDQYNISSKAESVAIAFGIKIVSENWVCSHSDSAKCV